MNDEWVTACSGGAEVPFGRYGANCVLAVGRMPFLPALAGQRFRLASQSFVFSVWRWMSGMRVVLMVEGGQTEWCICCSGRFPRSVRSRIQPGRAESSVAGFGVRIPSSEEGVGAGFAAREWVRARGSDSSPRNANMSRTGVRQGLQRLWPAVLQVSEFPPGPLKRGKSTSDVAGSGRPFERKARPARRFCKGYRLWVMGY